MKTKVKQSGTIPLDPTKIAKSDLIEAHCMLAASATLLRQAFGIVSMTNTLLKKPFSDSELKDFAKSFDFVHKSELVFAKGLGEYINSLPDDKQVLQDKQSN